VSLYLSQQTVLPQYTEEENEKCKELIAKLDIKIEYIKNPSDNPLLFNYIYENKHYLLTPKMLEVVVREKGNMENFIADDLRYKNLTIIRKSEAKELIEYIDKNINLYFENAFNELENNNQESEETLLYILNHEDLDLEYKKDIIIKVKTKIDDIKTVSDEELWKVLLENYKIIAKWDNLLFYYQSLEDKNIDSALIEYLNNECNYKQLSADRINNKDIFDKDKILNPFNTKLILASNLSDEAYSNLIKSIYFINYDNLDIEELSLSKVQSILTTNILSLTQENINRLKEYFSPEHITFIENKKDEFLEEFSEFELDSDDILKLLVSSKFTIEEKFTILENIDEIDDVKELKEVISKLYIENNKEINDIGIFENLFYGENKYNLELLVSQIKYFDDCEIIKPYLEAFEDKQYNELLNKSASKHYMDDSELNRELLKKLKDKDCISSWKENKRTLGENNLKVERKRV
jgi:hypothetical protein